MSKRKFFHWLGVVLVSLLTLSACMPIQPMPEAATANDVAEETSDEEPPERGAVEGEECLSSGEKVAIKVYTKQDFSEYVWLQGIVQDCNMKYPDAYLVSYRNPNGTEREWTSQTWKDHIVKLSDATEPIANTNQGFPGEERACNADVTANGQALSHIVPTPPNLDKAKIDEIVAKHKEARSAVGLGGLTWDSSLADFAQGWAKIKETPEGGNLPIHSQDTCYAIRYADAYGLAGSGAMGRGIENIGSVEGWIDEKALYDQKGGVCNSSDPDYNNCGHYANIVNKGVTQIGCGARSNGTLICQYK